MLLAFALYFRFVYMAEPENRCITLAPSFISEAQKIILCSPPLPLDNPEVPANCAHHVQLRFKTAATAFDVVTLCQNATSLGPAICFNSASQQLHHLSSANLLRLCSNALDEEPALCIAQLKASHYLRKFSDEDVVAYCTHTPSVLERVPDFLRCLPQVPNKAIPSKSHLLFCRDHPFTNATLACIHSLLRTSNKEFIVSLCPGLPSESTGLEPAQCLAQAPRKWSFTLRSALCRYAAPSFAPVTCAKALPHAWPEDAVLALCQNATSAEVQ
jgi:hypothetical protein